MADHRTFSTGKQRRLLIRVWRERHVTDDVHASMTPMKLAGLQRVIDRMATNSASEELSTLDHTLLRTPKTRARGRNRLPARANVTLVARGVDDVTFARLGRVNVTSGWGGRGFVTFARIGSCVHAPRIAPDQPLPTEALPFRSEGFSTP